MGFLEARFARQARERQEDKAAVADAGEATLEALRVLAKYGSCYRARSTMAGGLHPSVSHGAAKRLERRGWAVVAVSTVRPTPRGIQVARMLAMVVTEMGASAAMERTR